MMQHVRRALFHIPYEEVSMKHRGFEPTTAPLEARIEAYFHSFLDGYHAAIEQSDYVQLANHLDTSIEAELVGFAYEGAGMYLALLDYLLPGRKSRITEFTNGPALHQKMITLIGIGIVLARLPHLRWQIGHVIGRIERGVGWFAVDGYGFHEGFFDHQRTIVAMNRPRGLKGYAAKCFDNGLGRSIWFVEGANPEKIGWRIAQFPQDRRAALWSGIGLACSYAGGVYGSLSEYESMLDTLTPLATPYWSEFVVGLLFAAGARSWAEHQSPWMNAATRHFLNISQAEAGTITTASLEAAKVAQETDRTVDGYRFARDYISRCATREVAYV